MNNRKGSLSREYEDSKEQYIPGMAPGQDEESGNESQNKTQNPGVFQDAGSDAKNDPELDMYMSIYNKLLNDKNKRNPSVKKNWGSDEIKLLEYAVKTYLKKKKHGEDKLTTHDWKEIANFVPGRTESQCLYKWNLTKHKVSFRKSTWQGTEDKILKELVKKHGKKHWQKIANELNETIGGGSSRAGKQCRERWLNHLDDRIRKDPWTNREDLLLLEQQKKTGNRWSDIVKHLPGRTENMVKNRFNTLAKQKREEKRNRSAKKLGDILTGLGEKKEEDKNAWIDEKIAELKANLKNQGEDAQVIHVESLDTNKRPSLEEKRRSKIKDVRRNLEEPKRDKGNYNFIGSDNNNVFERFDQKDEMKGFCETTPQQQFRHKRRDFEHVEHLSPYGFPQRQLPPSSNNLNVFSTPKELSPRPTGLNEISKNLRVENRINTFNTSSNTIDDRIRKLINVPSGGSNQSEKLEIIKGILEEFKGLDHFAQDGLISNLQTQIQDLNAPKFSRESSTPFKSDSKSVNELQQDPLERVKERDIKPKGAKPTSTGKATKSVKNFLFNMHKEEANNLVKPPKKEEPRVEPIPEPKPTPENFQSPMINATPRQDKNKKTPGSFSKPQNNPPQSLPSFIPTPGYENNNRSNFEQMGSTFYGGSSYYEHGTPVRTMNDLSYSQFPGFQKSPYMHSPSPAMRNFNRIGLDTPQTGMSNRYPMRNDNVSLSGMNSPLLTYAGQRGDCKPNYPTMENNSMFKKN